MTIHRDWIAAWKKHGAEAFQRAAPAAIDVVFIDGQIKLMKSAFVRTWRDYLHMQFASPVRRYFERGARTVVLAFDNYEFVPPSKGMTQAKRRKQLPPVDEAEHTPLPPSIPENWDAAIMNRTFKNKVIAFVCEKLPAVVRVPAGKQLIIDWRGPPTVHSADGSLCELDTGDDGNSGLPAGEADVKFPQYCRAGSRMLVDAIDGDYLPIALLRLERHWNASRGPGDPRPPPAIFVYRMECKIQNAGVRDVNGRPKRSYEFVNVNALRDSILRHVLGGTRASALGNEFQLLTALIALTGCDYTKPLAQVSPQRLWDLLPQLWPALGSCYDGERFEPQGVADRVVAEVYKRVYARHVDGRFSQLAPLLAHLCSGGSGSGSGSGSGAKLAPSTLARLPRVESVVVTVRNANWLLLYWRADGRHPDPIDAAFGFARNARGLPAWADDVVPAPARERA